MGFTHAQATAVGSSGSTTQLVLTLTNNPAQGDLVIVAGHYTVGSSPTLTVQDGNANNYTATTSSPSTVGTASFPWFTFYLIAPANASKTVNLNLTANAGIVGFTDDFTVTGGTASFDTDVAGGSASSTSPLILPSITPAGAGELLYVGAVPATSNITGVGGAWVENSNGPLGGDDAAYILSSASGATATNFTSSGTQAYNSLAAAFFITPSVSASAYFRRPARPMSHKRVAS